MKRLSIFILLSLASFQSLKAQEESNFAYNTFEGTRVVVGHSTEMQEEGVLDFLIGHKFGRVNSGPSEFWGLDDAIIRLGFDYGIKDWINIGIGRSSLDKLVDVFTKVRVLRQQTGPKNIPVTITSLTTATRTALKSLDPLEPISEQNRYAFSQQFLISRQFSEKFSLQLAPSIIHYNLVDTKALKNDVISFGAAFKYQMSKMMALKGEYYYSLPNQLPENRSNVLSLGVDFDTGNHIFQVNLSNSGGLVEPAFIGNTTGKWQDGDIHIGFTISRVFKLKGRRY